MAKTIFITGASTGLGRALAEVAVADGHRVVGTVRDDGARAELDLLAPGRSFGRILDVTDTPAIGPLVDAVENGECDLAVAMFAKRVGGGFGFALGVPLRVFWANWLNAAATVAALSEYVGARFKGAALAWHKTEHLYPELDGKAVAPAAISLREAEFDLQNQDQR